MPVDYSVRSFKMAACVAIAAEIMAVVAMATPIWTETSTTKIGLWNIEDVASGNLFPWTNTADPNYRFYYSTWMNAVRGMIMAGVILGFIGICFNLYVIMKKKNEMVHGVTLMSYYMLSFAMVVMSVATYCCMIPQGVDAMGDYTSDEASIRQYIYRDGYGWSLWFGWVGAGVFLPAAGMAYEGSNQKRMSDRLAKYRE